MNHNTHIRSSVAGYQLVSALARDTQTEALQAQLLANYLSAAAAHCSTFARKSAAGRWAIPYVGVVLAAGMCDTTDMTQISSAGALWRCFGLAGDRPLAARDAWRLMLPYLQEPVLHANVIRNLEAKARVSLRRLPADPTPLDALAELTRPRAAPFLAQMSHWLGEYFRAHGEAENAYGEIYRKSLAEMTALNESGEVAVTSAHAIGQLRHITSEEWRDLVLGRVPRRRVEERAAFAAVKQFVVDFYEVSRTPVENGHASMKIS